jgi:hypothetical protein
MSLRRAVRKLPTAGAVLLWAVAGSAWAESANTGSDASVDQLVDRVIELRAGVEELDARLQSLRKEHESRMSSLARREGTLESERENQEMRVEKLGKRLTELREQAREAGAASAELKPVVAEAIDGAREYVALSLPFKRGERLAKLDELDSQLDSGALTPPRVANRLWSFHADEVRLTGESGIYRQPVDVGGEERLVDVARVGMMLLYFRGENGNYGLAEPAAGEWRFRHVDDRDSRAQIDALFDSLRKQIRTGYFRLPNPYAPEAQ